MSEAAQKKRNCLALTFVTSGCSDVWYISHVLLTSCHDRSADSAPSRCHEVVLGHELLVDPPRRPSRTETVRSRCWASRWSSTRATWRSTPDWWRSSRRPPWKTKVGQRGNHDECTSTALVVVQRLVVSTWKWKPLRDTSKGHFHQSMLLFFSVYEKVGALPDVCTASHPALSSPWEVLVLSQIIVKVLTAAA